jgi:RNA polymerase sigma factor (sigma-70 family)
MANRSLHPLLLYLRRLGGSVAGEGALEDAQLLHRFLASRDESAFTTIVQRYGAMVWGLCVRRLGETAEAEDAFQATFLVLVRKAASLHGSQSLGPWLYGVAYRTALKLRGKRARRIAREAALPEQLAEQRPEEIWSDLRPILDEEVNRLPEKYRLPVVLCYLQGLSSEEAAQRLGCAKGTIFSRLSRARDLLRPRLARRGLDVSAGALAVVLAENAALRAAVPTALREITIRTSLLLAAGTAGQAMSASLAALVEGVVRSMFLSKVKFAAIVLLALGLAGTGAGFLGHRSDAEQPASKPKPAPAAPRAPAAVADKAKDKDDAAKAYVPPPAVDDEKQRLRDWRDKLVQPVRIDGIDDPETTWLEVLDLLAKRYNMPFLINERAFRSEGVDLRKCKIASCPLPEMKASMRTVLQTILDRVDLPDGSSAAVFLVRKNHIEITTSRFLRRELGYRKEGSILPLIWDSFEETPLTQIVPRLAETSGFNIVADPQAGEKLQTKLTAQLNNVPVNTAVRLLANMAGLSVVRLDNVFYVTTAENAKHLREEQAKINADRQMEGVVEPAKKPANDKPAK